MVKGVPDSGYLVPSDFWESMEIDYESISPDSDNFWVSQCGETEAVKPITRSGRFYSDAREKEKENNTRGDAMKECEEDVVLKQLRQTKANASVWDLLVASKTHRDAMFEALASLNINVNSTPQDLVQLVKGDAYIIFSDKELTSEGRKYIRALYIQVEAKGMIVPKVMVDDGSALNVCPLKVLPKLGITKNDMQKIESIVRAYDESKRPVEGTFKTAVKVGPIESIVEFMVVDIPISYALLLGRPWFHALGGVPSTLHQKIKFPFNNEIITISAEEDGICSKVNLEAENPPITGFNLVGGIYEDYMDPQVAVMMKNMKFFPDLGLGKNQQGTPTIPVLRGQNTRVGLGYNQETAYKSAMQTERGIFLKEGTHHVYKNMKPQKEWPGWEIFNDAVKDVCIKKKWDVNNMLIGLNHVVGVQAEVETISMEDYVQNNSKTLSLDDDVFISDVMDDNDVFLSKFNEINTNFAYLFDVFPNASICTLDYLHSIFHINSMHSISFNLGTTENPKEILLGSNCTPEFKERHERILKDKQVAFAWTYEDMPGIDRHIAQHYIPTYDDAKPIKQKLRRMKPEWAQKVKEEVEKQIEDGFLEVIDYPEWLANIVPVAKKDGKVRMCVDYRDLNKASPKDDFPLPNIDVLVDAAAEMLWYTCCDGFSGYNQVLTAQIHKAKTSFITEWGTFCYKVMPFELENAGSTYQLKAKSEEEYFEALEKFLDRVIKYNLRLNPKKCIFGVGSCKLLGYVVSQKGIDIDPDKVKAIKKMHSPRTETEVRGFLGMLQYISRFIVKLTSLCAPIFNQLKKSQSMIWSEQCQEAFDRIKEYLSNPQILKPPKSGKPLTLYLSIEEQSMGAMLAQEDVGYVEHVVY
ncbi:uncharacterized protein LOC126687702 [Mercurialis annua]|uniref:uncharacterized protein LOC126687702 n=1 Tax=Mercurialis annua TaxID=3986 RepID=UPI002160473B|nr:uncharacterized protein LOC126687702 [Mercurialis annua]